MEQVKILQEIKITQNVLVLLSLRGHLVPITYTPILLCPEIRDVLKDNMLKWVNSLIIDNIFFAPYSLKMSNLSVQCV